MHKQKSGTINSNIQCSVESCAYYSKDYCSLNQIQVGCTDKTVTNCHSTECASFESAHGGAMR